MVDARLFRRGFALETKEHPTMPASSRRILVMDHIREYGAKAYPPKKK